MSRRSTPQKTLDDRAFPVRVKILVPPLGLGRKSDVMNAWLVREVGHGEFARHAASGIAMDATAIYFRDVETACAFCAAYQLLRVRRAARREP